MVELLGYATCSFKPRAGCPLRGMAGLGRAPPAEGWNNITSLQGSAVIPVISFAKMRALGVRAPEFQEHCTEAERPSVAVFLELFGTLVS